MNKYEIKLSDWQRILFGNAPVEFLIEVFFRTLFIYLILLIVIRILGKRMSGQLTSTEMAVMLLLGAIVSAPMQMPDRGIVQGVFLLLLITFFQQWITNRMRKNERLERKLQGTVSILVKDGELNLHEMDVVNISREQLFAALRAQGIYNLGEVKRLYLEVSGEFTTFRQQEARPGLSILPRKDESIHERQQIFESGEQVCSHCGHLQQLSKQIPGAVCAACEKTAWIKPVL
jgi:uncharacterized membrane protein YcaP (DUF421 family)